jgi:hypothetical protein
VRYVINTSNREIRQVFKTGLVYDERHVHAELKKLGLRAVRPNGDTRTRGSRRMVVFGKNRTVLAVLQADIKEDTGPVLPVKVGYL